MIESEVKGDDTFLDAVYEEISQNVSDKSAFLAQAIIEANGYDTDALNLDLQMSINDDKSSLSELLSDNKETYMRMVRLLQKYTS